MLSWSTEDQGVSEIQNKIIIAICTGVELSKILGGWTKILGEKVVKSDKYMGDSQLLGARARSGVQRVLDALQV